MSQVVKFRKALRIIKFLKEIGTSRDDEFYVFDFGKKVDGEDSAKVDLSVKDGEISCTCRDCSTTSRGRCVYVYALSIYRLLPNSKREFFVDLLLRGIENDEN